MQFVEEILSELFNIRKIDIRGEREQVEGVIWESVNIKIKEYRLVVEKQNNNKRGCNIQQILGTMTMQ
jgi:hypothetical protein